MSRSVGETKLTERQIKLANELLQGAGRPYARSVHLRDKERDYKGSVEEALRSILYSTQLMYVFLDMDEQQLSRPWWLEEFEGTIPLKSVQRVDADVVCRIAGELHRITARALEEWTERSG